MLTVKPPFKRVLTELMPNIVLRPASTWFNLQNTVVNYIPLSKKKTSLLPLRHDRYVE